MKLKNMICSQIKIQDKNWQYLIERILEICRFVPFTDTLNMKEVKIIQNSVANITICKQCYFSFYNQISEYLGNTLTNLPPDKPNKIDCDLQRNFYFIDFDCNQNNDEIIAAFCDFFQTSGRFPGSQQNYSKN